MIAYPTDVHFGCLRSGKIRDRLTGKEVTTRKYSNSTEHGVKQGIGQSELYNYGYHWEMKLVDLIEKIMSNKCCPLATLEVGNCNANDLPECPGAPLPPPRHSRSRSRGKTPGSKSQSWVEDEPSCLSLDTEVRSR